MGVEWLNDRRKRDVKKRSLGGNKELSLGAFAKMIKARQGGAGKSVPLKR